MPSITVWDKDGNEYEAEILGGTYTPGDPGRISGPPEYCYPPEPPEVEWETLEVTLHDEDGNVLGVIDPTVTTTFDEHLGYETGDALWDAIATALEEFHNDYDGYDDLPDDIPDWWD